MSVPVRAQSAAEPPNCHGRDCGQDDCTSCSSMRAFYERLNGPHVYLSTGCLHGEHDYCASMTGQQGEKRPGRCKWCDALCRCVCHCWLKVGAFSGERYCGRHGRAAGWPCRDAAPGEDTAAGVVDTVAAVLHEDCTAASRAVGLRCSSASHHRAQAERIAARLMATGAGAAPEGRMEDRWAHPTPPVGPPRRGDADMSTTDIPPVLSAVFCSAVDDWTGDWCRRLRDDCRADQGEGQHSYDGTDPWAEPTETKDAMTTHSPEITEYIDSLREEIDRHDGSLPTAVGMIIGAASSCWSNLSGAGVFESQRASALVDLLLSYTGPFEPAASSPETGDQG